MFKELFEAKCNKLKVKTGGLLKKYTVTKNGSDCFHQFDINGEISDETDLIMFFKEGLVDTGDIETGDDYQFNNLYYAGSDLIDLLKKYGL